MFERRDFSLISRTVIASGAVTLSPAEVTSGRREGCSAFTARRIALMCSGFVPQQPPASAAPVCTNRFAYSAMYSGDVM